jgi:hypothetical protein
MEDILDDPGYRALSAHDKVAWLDLLAIFNRQKAHTTGNVVVLPWSRAMAAMSSQNRRGACARAARLAREVGAHFARVPGGLLCYIPKWAESQGLPTTQLRRVSVAIPSPTPTPTPTLREEKSQRGVETPEETAEPQEPKQLKLNPEPHYPDAAASLEPPAPDPDPAGTHTQSAVKISRGDREKRSKPSAESEAAFDLLLWSIDQSTPGASIPDPGTGRWRRWCQELDRLHRLGERGGDRGAGFSWEEIEAVIRWLPTHQGSGDFRWGLVVRSAVKLRQHFARLLAESRSAGQPTRSGGWRLAAQEVHRSIMETGDG